MEIIPESILRRTFYGLVSLTHAEQDLDYPDWVDALNPRTQLWHGAYRDYPINLSFQELDDRNGMPVRMSVEIPPPSGDGFVSGGQKEYLLDSPEFAEMIWGKQISVDIYLIADAIHRGVVVTRVVNRQHDYQFFHHQYPDWVHSPQDILDYIVDSFEEMLDTEL